MRLIQNKKYKAVFLSVFLFVSVIFLITNALGSSVSAQELIPVDKSQPAGITGFDYYGKLQRCNNELKKGDGSLEESPDAQFCKQALIGRSDDSVTTCEKSGGPFNPITCPLAEAADAIIYSTIEYRCEDGAGERDFLKRFLAVDFSENGGFNQNAGQGLGNCEEAYDLSTGLKSMWSKVRDLTNGIFVILFVLAILGHVTGAIEAYTAKKIIPRIVIAAILTQLSWFISTELSAIFDDFGAGLSGLAKDTLDTGEVCLKSLISGGDCKTGFDVGLAALVGIAGYAITGLAVLAIIIPIFGAILGAIIASYIRVVLLIFLILISPIAAVFISLPNTEKWARKWMSWFMVLLAMYPIVAVALEVSKAAALAVNPEDSFGWYKVLATITSVMVYIAGYAVIPYSLKFVSQAISTLTGVNNDPTKGPVDRARNWANKNYQLNEDLKKQRRLAKLQTLRDAERRNPDASLLDKGKNGMQAAWLQRFTGTGFTRYNKYKALEKRQKAFEEEVKKEKLILDNADVAGRQIQTLQNLQVKINALIDDAIDVKGRRDALDAREQKLFDILDQIDTANPANNSSKLVQKLSDAAEEIITNEGYGQLTKKQAAELGYHRFAGGYYASDAELSVINNYRAAAALPTVTATQVATAGSAEEYAEMTKSSANPDGLSTKRAKDSDYLVPITIDNFDGSKKVGTESNPYGTTSQDNIIHQRKVAVLQAVATTDKGLPAKNKDSVVNWNGKARVVTPAMQAAAVGSILQLHGNKPNGARVIDEWLSRDTTGSGENALTHQVAVQYVFDNEVDGLIGKMGHVVFGSERAMATDSLDRALGISGGGLKDWLRRNQGLPDGHPDKDKLCKEDATNKTFTSFIRQYLVAASSEVKNSDIQEGLVGFTFTEARARNNLSPGDPLYKTHHFSDEQMKVFKTIFDEKTGLQKMGHKQTRQYLEDKWVLFD